MNIVITGTSRGIGLKLAKKAVAEGHRVLAVARSVQALQGLGFETLSVDVTSSEAAGEIYKAIQAWSHLDLLINNAGVYRGDASPQDFMDSFRVNSVAPFFITQALLPALKKAAQAKAVHISSLMGSVSDNASGGSYSYRASKAALNMICKSLSIDQKWLTSVVLHPGWVQTDMGGANAPTSVEESVAGLWRVIGGLKREDTGHFFDFRGQPLSW